MQGGLTEYNAGRTPVLLIYTILYYANYYVMSSTKKIKMPLAEKMLLFAGTVTKNSGPEAQMYKFIHNSSALHLLARVPRTRSTQHPPYENSE